jgi:CRISPR/Cas system Type II protein with McrA/HNH and RuvC-like nuclease domain
MLEVGLDLGTNSVGWAVVAPTNGRAHLAAGSYVFPEAGEEEGGEFVSNRRKRGDKRRQRKQLRRKRQRRRSVASLLVNAGFLPKDESERVQILTSGCPYQARAQALVRKLEPHEFGRAIYHLAKRRGYLSTAALKLIGIPNVGELDARLARRAIERSEAEEGQGKGEQEALKEAKGVLDNIERTRQRLQAGEARTLGELLYKELQNKRPVRVIKGSRIVRPLENAVRRAIGSTIWEEKLKARERDEILNSLKKLAPLVKKEERTAADEEKINHLLATLKNHKLDRETALYIATHHVREEVLGIRGDRRLYEEEFDEIVKEQRKYYPDILTEEYISRLREAIFHQRPLKPTSGLVGYCSLLPQKKRCPMATMLAQRSVILQRLTTLEICHRDGSRRRLRPDEIHKLADALDQPTRLDADRGKKLSWDKAAEIIGLSNDEWFADNPPAEDGKKKRRAKGASGLNALPGNRTCIALHQAIGEKWDRLPVDGNHGKSKEGLIHRLLTCRQIKDIAPGLKRDFGFTDEEIYYLATAKLPEGYNKHCAKVLRKIEPFLRKGLVYSEALEKAGLREPNVSTERIPENPSEYAAAPLQIANPVVQRAVKNAIIVLNAIIKKYGKPDIVRIELPRDVARTNKQRQKVQDAQKRREEYNKQAENALREAGLPVSGRNILKVRLWQEAGCRSPYRPDEELTIHQVVNECDIDHIIPRSRSLDDSYTNLTIAPNQVNLVKGDRTPYEAFGNDDELWSKIVSYLNTIKTMSRSKKARILARKLEETGFVGRDFSDTSYIASEVTKAVKAIGVPVEVTRGALTAELRKLWGLNEVLPLTDEERARLESANKRGSFKNRDDHRHHALDAIVTALMNRSTFQRLTKYYKTRENHRNVPKSEAEKFQLEKPWPSFVQDVARVIEAAPVVFQPTRGVQGALHKETGRTPPSREEVEKAIAALPEHRRRRIRRAVVVGSRLVYLDKNGKPLTAYDLYNNHHCIIWQCKSPHKKGRLKRELEVVTMIEAATRATCGEPVFSAAHSGRGPEWEPFLFLCKNDIVEYDHPEHGRRLMRVANFSQWTVVRTGKRGATTSTAAEIVLRPVRDAREIEGHDFRVKGQDRLALVLRRVILSPLGDEIGSEPENADDQPDR